MPFVSDPLKELPWVQWKPEGDLTDNQNEVEELLANHHTRCKRVGDVLLLQAWGGMDETLNPGDCLVLDGDRLGIVRVPDSAPKH
jgi:hypothetical protein